MNRRLTKLIALLVSFTPCLVEANERPNVMIILADDLGFSDLGCYGSEISTPNLDGLARGGIRHAQFYNTARCWPTRGALMTGYYAQQINRDAIPGYQGGGHGKRPKWAKLLPERLKAAGYRSYHSGKWHIDGPPIKGGFDQSYWLNDHGRFFSPRRHFANDKKLPQVERGTDYYATTEVASHAIQCLKDHQANQLDQPFLSYVAFTAPHFPLHALPEDIEKYEGKYNRGWEAIRAARWKAIQAEGFLNTSLSAVERNLGPPLNFPKDLDKLGPGEVFKTPKWNELSDTQKKFQASKMEIHAAMVDRMDIEIGRIIEQLKEMNAFENTLILFLSDNGASAEIMVRDDGHDPTATPGSADSHLCLGPGWSSVSNTPFRRHKTWVHEGGSSTPLIAHWPKGISARGTWSQQVGHVIDIVPSILEVVELDELENRPDFPGQSHLKHWSSSPDEIGNTNERELWWCHLGHRAMRQGDWKLVALSGKSWKLYDLRKDRAEQTDLAEQNPELVKQLATRWEKKSIEFAKQSGRKKEME